MFSRVTSDYTRCLWEKTGVSGVCLKVLYRVDALPLAQPTAGEHRMEK